MKKILCALLGMILTLPVFAACPSGQIEQTYVSATGTVTQNGTPSPDNPIEPTFYQQGNMILRKVGDTYADSYDATTGKITRRVGVKVLDGTEDWFYTPSSSGAWLTNMYSIIIANMYAETTAVATNRKTPYCTHFERSTDWAASPDRNLKCLAYKVSGASVTSLLGLGYPNASNENLASFKQWLADQYTAGTPVTVYYPLKAENYYTEDWAAEQCTSSSPIKIATTAYNSARFSPVVTELNDTIATIRSVVTNTINQTKAIADLQATKQTRPNENCPAGKKCLLVEDNDGTPHWYEIIENAYALPSGYTQVDYVTNTAQTMINTGVKFDFSKNYEIELKVSGVTGSWYILQAREHASAPISGVSGSMTGNQISFGLNGTYVQASQISRVFGHIYYIKGTINNGNVTLYVKDETTGTEETATGTYTVTTGQSVDMGLFGNTGGNYVAINSDVYFARIKEDGNYIMDYVPAKQGTTAGFYDKVSGTFKTATGLSAGPEI